jgi:hypothetical protein
MIKKKDPNEYEKSTERIVPYVINADPYTELMREQGKHVYSLPQDLTSKDKQIMWQGALQHCVISQSLFAFATNPEEWWKLVVETATKMVKLIEEKRQ